MSNGGQTGTVTSSSGPPQWLQGPLQYGAQQAKSIYQSPSPQYYPGSTVANPSTATQAGNQAAIGLGLNGNPAENAGTGYLTRTLNGQGLTANPLAGTQAGNYMSNVLSGQYLNQGNPYQAQLNKSIEAGILPSVNAQFSLAGRYGSGAHQGTLGTALANAEAPLEYQNYQQERGNQQAVANQMASLQQQQSQFNSGLQQAAAGMAPQYAQQEQSEIAGLQQAGANQDVLAQNQVNANVNHWNYNQNLAQNKLQQYMGLLLNGGFGTQGTQTQTQPTSPMGFLGGLLGGIL